MASGGKVEVLLVHRESTAYLFSVVKAFIVILHCRSALLLSSFTLSGIDDVTA
jgi:hypothetical protein